MAEIAGTVVGVFSLSIQLFEKLSNYTNSVKDARYKAEQITHELDNLLSLLENLESVLGRIQDASSAVWMQVGIQECSHAIKTIRAKLGDDTQTASSSRLWNRLRKVVKRLAYPFKETDINYWQDVLKSVRHNLQIALLTLNTDQQQQRFSALQLQIEQFSLRTETGIQKLLDQQRTLSVPHRRYLGKLNPTSNSECFAVPEFPVFGQNQMIDDKRSDYLAQILLPISAVDLEYDVQKLRILTRTMQPRNSRMKGALNACSCCCTCRVSKQQTYIFRQPFALSLEQQYLHQRHCEYRVPEAYKITMSIGIMLYYLVLGLKFRIFITLSIGAGTFTIAPSLTYHRIVDKVSSPAFRLISSINERGTSLGVLRQVQKEMSKIFQTRQSSPHDCLQNGWTLLHHLCSTLAHLHFSILPDEVENLRKLFNQLLGYMPLSVALQIDSCGMTCVDLLRYTKFRNTLMIKSIVPHLLQRDLQITGMFFEVSYDFNSHSLLDVSFADLPDPFPSINSAQKAILLKSETELIEMINKDRSDCALDSDAVYQLYLLTTGNGWLWGCKHLRSAGLSYAQGHRPYYPYFGNILFQAVRSGSSDMVKYWLDVRKIAAAEDLAYIGDLESVVAFAIAMRSQQVIMKILVTHLVDQRRWLQQAVERYGSQCSCVFKSAGILDVHASCALRVLDEEFDVPPSIRPTRRSIYHERFLYCMPFAHPNYDPARDLQMLYESGFTDVGGKYLECNRDAWCPPLIYGIIASSSSIQATLDTADWFLSKGAKWNEVWPGSRTAASHCLGDAVGRLFPKESFKDEVASVLQHNIHDDCACHCSTHGCTSATSFLKSSYAQTEDLVDLGVVYPKHNTSTIRSYYLTRFDRNIACVSLATQDAQHKWILSEFIRLCVFVMLGIRHICCNLDKIIMPFGEPDFTRQPLPRYSPEELQTIAEEDAHLISILEEMVPRFDKQCDEHDGDLRSFVDDVLIPEMIIVLERLKKEDETEYAAGRREVGVVMYE